MQREKRRENIYKKPERRDRPTHHEEKVVFHDSDHAFAAMAGTNSVTT